MCFTIYIIQTTADVANIICANTPVLSNVTLYTSAVLAECKNFVYLCLKGKVKFACNDSLDFQKYLSTAPVLLTIWMTFTAGFIIEINRFFPDMLGLYF